MILNYTLGYVAFLFGMLIYLLGKINEYKKLAKAHPNPLVNFSLSKLWSSEWANVIQVLLGGLALVIFLPMLIGNYQVDFKSSSGAIIATVNLKAVLIPLYFFIGYSGNSAVFMILGKYKKELISKIGGE